MGFGTALEVYRNVRSGQREVKARVYLMELISDGFWRSWYLPGLQQTSVLDMTRPT